MAIPDFQSVMLPLLVITGDNKEHSLREIIDSLSAQYNLTNAEKVELLPSGQQATFTNRVGWAVTYMKKACLLESTRKSHFKITARGLRVLQQKPTAINIKFLKQYPEFIAFQSKGKTSKNPAIAPATLPEAEQTPEEAIESSYQTIRDNLASELLKQIMVCSPAFFEQLVVDLLVKMGYGGSRKDAGQAVGKSGDGGIDGIIKEDRLGLDVIYIQAKRWESNVSRPEIQKFAGALQGHHAKKGVFITTSEFSDSAIEFANRIESKVVLISGETLAKLMIDYNVGVSPTRLYELKSIDSDYFLDG